MENDLQFHLLELSSCDIEIEEGNDKDKEEVEVFYNNPHDDIEDETPSNVENNRDNVKKQFVVHLFGSTKEGTSVRVEVFGFRPYFFLKIDESKTPERFIDSVKQYLLKNGIVSQIEDNLTAEPSIGVSKSSVSLNIVKKKEFYGFSANKLFPFVKITVSSLQLFYRIRNLFVNKAGYPELKNNKYLFGIPPVVYESNIDPMLRFIHEKNISPCDWLVVRNGMSCVDTAQKEWAVDCESTDIFPSDYEKSAPFTIASWDIECYSYTGEFPIPKRSWDTMLESCTSIDTTMKYISTKVPSKMILTSLEVIQKTLEENYTKSFSSKLLPKILKDHLIIGGDPVIQIGTILSKGPLLEKHLFAFPDCSPIEDSIVHVFPDESTMLSGWFEWMTQINPDILIGYNVFGFDENYIWNRLEELKLTSSDSIIHSFSRLRSTGSQMECKEKFLSSSALGDNFMHIWTTHGRLQIDLYHYIRRLAVLPSYKLDSVVKYYMSGKLIGVNRVSDTDIDEYVLEVSGAIKDVRPGRALCLLDESGESITEKLIVSKKEGSKIFIKANDISEEELSDAVKWVIVKDDITPQDIFRLHCGDAKDRSMIGKYCIQDCELVLELYKKLEVFNNAMSMANVCSVPISYIFTRGQGIKIESLIFRECAKWNTLIQVMPSPKQRQGVEDSETGSSTYEGAIVLEPEPGFYDTPIGVADFASLYPSTIVSENISHDSLVWVKDYIYKDINVLEPGKLKSLVWGSDKYDNLPDYEYVDIDFDILIQKPGDTRKHPDMVKAGRRVCRYAQPFDGSKSTLPTIINQLLEQRKNTRNEAKKEKDTERLSLLDAKQLAYKLTANSLYGQLGSETFKVRLQHLAASVTGYGRKQLLFARDIILKKFPTSRIVYGDTDSLFIDFGDHGELKHASAKERRERIIEKTENMCKTVNQFLKQPHDFEFDKVFDPLLMFSKKRYAGNMYEDDAEHGVLKYMGIVLKRRDNAPIVKTIYSGALKKILNERDIVGATQFVKNMCMELVNGNISLSQLTITKSLSASYKDPTRIAHKVLAERIAEREPGNAPTAGERVEYVYVRPRNGQQESKLQGDRIETPSFIKANKLQPDYKFYIEHQISNPLSQLFGLLLESMPEYEYTGTTKPSSMEARELLASKILFDICTRKADNILTKYAANEMWKNSTVSLKNEVIDTYSKNTRAVQDIPTNTRTTRSSSKKSSMIQTTLGAFIVDKQISKDRKKEEKKKKHP